ncbi:MAG TPA: hypothetical protein VJU80_07275 [Solirubrobacteraceae bacterium]|nr:hypothetical protein [Solirubrobacteraceae bacterium]
MKGRIQSRNAKWIRVGLVVAALIASHALHDGSAEAATIPPQTTVLAGFTSQQYPVFFKISSDRKMLQAGGIAISMSCTSGATVVVPDAFARVPIHSNGRLHAAFSSPTILTNGTTTQGTDALSATLSPKHLTGTWQLTVNYGFADGTSDHCASGPVHFKLTSS